MRLTTEQLEPALRRGLKPLYTVFGDETLLALEAGDRIRSAARTQGYAEREVLVADAGFRWSDLAFAGSSQSLFSTRRLLELRIPNGKPGSEGGAALQSFCERLPADTVSLVQLPALDWRAQKSAWFEALEAAGIAVEARVVTRKALPQWLSARLAAQDQQAEPETLDFIADRVEGNLMAAYQEVQKLALLFPKGRIDFDSVREAVVDVARYDVFSLGEAMLEGDPVRLSRMLDGLKGEGEAPPLVLWTMTDEIRAIGKVASGCAAGKPIEMLMRDARIRGPSHQALMRANYARYSESQVSAALRHAAAIDRMVKGLVRGDVWNELLQLGLRFAKGNRRTAPAPGARSAVSSGNPALF